MRNANSPEITGDSVPSEVPIKKLFACHVDSFNHLTNLGFDQILRCVKPEKFQQSAGCPELMLWLEDLKLESLKFRRRISGRTESQKTPRGCREGGESYKAPLSVQFCWQIDGENVQRRVVNLGDCPVMVKSDVCSLALLSPAQLVARGEEAHEAGGYFIINGIERMIRMIIQQRRHHILGLCRRAFTKRSPLFSEFATVIRCVTADEHSSIVRLHYMRTGALRLALQHRRQEFFIPAGIVLRALAVCSDAEMYRQVCLHLRSAGTDETFIEDRLALLQRECHELQIRTQMCALSYLGQHFRTLLDLSSDESDISVGERFLEDFIYVHLQHNGDKLSLPILMLSKLLSIVTGRCSPDDPDSLVNQEVLVPGLLLQAMIREKVRIAFQKVVTHLRRTQGSWSEETISHLINESGSSDVGKVVEYFLATGNLVSPTGLGLSQTSGFTIVAEKLNYFRYISHFRSVHRGAYFMELRTTTVRKLLPESWGFLCPVHTPDGSPCGLLNHLAEMCEIVMPDTDHVFQQKRLLQIHSVLDRALISVEQYDCGYAHVPVVLEGSFVGYISAENASHVISALRAFKVTLTTSVLRMSEISYIHPGGEHGLFPGLYIFYGPSRLMRPVKQVESMKVEFIGTLEQAFLSISAHQVESHNASYTHAEIRNTSALSCVASLTPWSDFNQSPRNMYQCQMAKQTMGTPMHTICYRSDTKLYRLHTPQRPLALTCTYDKYSLDDYALGTNAVVAVIAYTGYDMEDAMIVNKGSLHRGFAHATLYKTLVEGISANETLSRRDNTYTSENKQLDGTGSVQLGSIVRPGDTLLNLHSSDGVTKGRSIRLRGTDAAVVDKVVLTQSVKQAATRNDKRAAITLRYDRNPVIGDKFSSRHGQKGVLSFLWPEEDMPFSDRTGLRPDVIINPHAFPSRMTIGMLVESLAAKAGASTGIFADATPFKHSDKEISPTEEYGKLLRESGYNFCGSERLVNGCTGESFSVDIFIGLVYYQRLRHMVSLFHTFHGSLITSN